MLFMSILAEVMIDLALFFLRKMAEIEITPVDAADLGNSARFTLKIVTEQTHATELVEMLTRRGCSVEASDRHSKPSGSAVKDDDNNQDYTDALQNI